MLKFKTFNLSILGVAERFYLMMAGVIILGFMGQFLFAAIWGFAFAVSFIVGFTIKWRKARVAKKNALNIVSKNEQKELSKAG